MGTRALTRLGLETALLERLHSKRLQVSFAQALLLPGSQMHTPILLQKHSVLRGVRQTVRDVLLLSQLELTETLDVAPATASALLLAVSRSVTGAPSTVSAPPRLKQESSC